MLLVPGRGYWTLAVGSGPSRAFSVPTCNAVHVPPSVNLARLRAAKLLPPAPGGSIHLCMRFAYFNRLTRRQRPLFEAFLAEEQLLGTLDWGAP